MVVANYLSNLPRYRELIGEVGEVGKTVGLVAARRCCLASPLCFCSLRRLSWLLWWLLDPSHPRVHSQSLSASDSAANPRQHPCWLRPRPCHQSADEGRGGAGAWDKGRSIDGVGGVRRRGRGRGTRRRGKGGDALEMEDGTGCRSWVVSLGVLFCARIGC